MPKVEFDRERCKGCELCVSVCPTKIILMDSKINRKGYKVATVHDMDKCIGCGNCYRICPDTVITVFK